MAHSSNPFDNSASNLPQRSTRREPAPKKRGGGIDLPSVDIPWKLIVFLALCILAVILLICFWDVITYIIGKIISALVTLAILLFLLRLLFRRRR